LINITIIVSHDGTWYSACKYQAEVMPRIGTEIKVKNTNLPALMVSRVQHVVSDIGLEEVRVFGTAFLINLHLEGLLPISDFEPPNVTETSETNENEADIGFNSAAEAEQQILNKLMTG
jgi:hypothetical protein